MNGRTCLLCGKSLSRIRVGGGEDFCSREHRNQYRLRKGMDRLQEANQMASLMRRREHPKALNSDRPFSDTGKDPRPFPHQIIRTSEAVRTDWTPKFNGRGYAMEPAPPVLQPRGADCNGALARPAPVSKANQIRGDRKLLALRHVPAALQGSVSPAPPSDAAGRVHLKKSRGQQFFATIKPSAMKPAVGQLGANANPLSEVGLHPVQRSHKRIHTPRKGVKLRVSMAKGFRRPAMTTARLASAPRLEASIVWTPPARRIAAIGRAAEASTMSLRGLMSTGVMQTPGAPPDEHATDFHWPEALSVHQELETIPSAVRFFDRSWVSWEALFQLPESNPEAGPPEPHIQPTRGFVLKCDPACAPSAGRIATAPFVVQDVPFGYSEEELRRR